MKRLLSILALALLASFSSQAQILYKISGNGLSKPSYIVGTYHLAPATFADSIPGLREAFAATEQVYGEVDMMETLAPENAAKMQAAMMLPEGKTLSTLLTKEQMDRLNALMRELMGVDMTNEAVAGQLDKLSPMVLETQLTLLVYMKNMKSLDPTDLIDTYFQREATKTGKAIGGLESAEFQMELLYGAPLEEQVEGLMCFVDNFQESTEIADFIAAAYFSQDLDMIGELTVEEQEGACGGDPESSAKLIYDRNENWVKAMPDIMKQAPTFFAVGAAHLCGDKGVLHLLEEAGYKIEGVKK